MPKLSIRSDSLISNLFKLFSYETLYSNFMFLDQLFFEVLCKHTHTHTHTHTNSVEYFIVVFCKNATITNCPSAFHLICTNIEQPIGFSSHALILYWRENGDILKLVQGEVQDKPV